MSQAPSLFLARKIYLRGLARFFVIVPLTVWIRKHFTPSHSTFHTRNSFNIEYTTSIGQRSGDRSTKTRRTKLDDSKDLKMVCTDCGCKDYFEDGRSDTESLTPHRPPVITQPDYCPPMFIPTMIAQPAPAYVPNPDPITDITPGAVVQTLAPLPPPQPPPVASLPFLPPGTGPPNPIPFPQPAYQPQQPQPLLMPAASIPQISPPAAPGVPQIAPPGFSLAPPVPQPGPIRQQPNFGSPQIPQGPTAIGPPPPQGGPGIIGPPGGPAPMLPMPVPPQGLGPQGMMPGYGATIGGGFPRR